MPNSRQLLHQGVRPACALPADHMVSRDVPTLIYDSAAWVLAEHYDRLRAAIEEYLLWEPGRRGHAAAHGRLRDALNGGDHV